MQRRNWTAAIDKILKARAVLKSDPRLWSQLNLMLAECHGRLGQDEQRILALRQASEGGIESEPARLVLGPDPERVGQTRRGLEAADPAGGQPARGPARGRALFLTEGICTSPPRSGTGRMSNSDWMPIKARPEGEQAAILLRADILLAQDRFDEARAQLHRGPDQGTRRTWSTGWRWRGCPDSRRNLPRPWRSSIRPRRIWGRAWVSSSLASITGLSSRDAGAKAAIAKLAESRNQMPAAELPRFLERLATAELRLGEPALARQS